MTRLVVIAGPTGTGKSDLAIAMAERVGGQVINADSMQLYRGMDIGTAKVPVSQRRGIEHHLIDVLPVTATASVAVFQRQARDIVELLLANNVTPILTGGSGLYIQAVIDGIAFPGTDPELRAHYLTLVDQRGAEVMHAELAVVDPIAADAILPTNGRRIARALEVVALTGQPFSANLPVPGPARYDAVQLVLDCETTGLDTRLAQRVHSMVAAGFVGEVRGLLTQGLRDGTTARRALGYDQLIRHLDGELELESAVEQTITATRRFVRRQRSWFRRDARRIELDTADPDLLEVALAHLAAGSSAPP